MVWSRSRSRAAAPCQRGEAATPTDAALVAAARCDPHAFLLLYERYIDRVYQYCYARLGSRDAAEDATSDVFTKTLAALGRYQDVLFAAWLFRIAHNVVVDHYRRRPTAPLDTAWACPDPARGPEEAAVASADGAALQTALAPAHDTAWEARVTYALSAALPRRADPVLIGRDASVWVRMVG